MGVAVRQVKLTLTALDIDRAEVLKLIGTAIRDARKARGLTQDQAALMIDVTRTQLTNIELGRSFLSAESLVRCIVNFNLRLDAKFFGVKP